MPFSPTSSVLSIGPHSPFGRRLCGTVDISSRNVPSPPAKVLAHGVRSLVTSTSSSQATARACAVAASDASKTEQSMAGDVGAAAVQTTAAVATSPTTTAVDVTGIQRRRTKADSRSPTERNAFTADPFDENRDPGEGFPLHARPSSRTLIDSDRVEDSETLSTSRRRTLDSLRKILTKFRCAAALRGRCKAMVDLRGFEPLTSSMRTRRATNCATGPWCVDHITIRARGARPE